MKSIGGMSLQNFKIKCIGTYIPDNYVNNMDLLTTFEVSPDFIENKLGIIRRSKIKGHQTLADMCLSAWHDLEKKSKLTLKNIDLVCTVTQTPDHKAPYMSAILHNKIGLSKKCITFDIGQGCAGFCHALLTVLSMMKTLHLKNALFFTCDQLSRILDPKDKNTVLLFGDAATVTYITKDVSTGYILKDWDFGTLPNSYETIIEKNFLRMDGRMVFNNVLKEIPASIKNLLLKNGLDTCDISEFLCHQPSRYLLERLSSILNLKENQLKFKAANYGNTSSSSIPLILEPHLKQKDANYLVLSGFGTGFSWCNCLLTLTGGKNE